MMAGKLSALRPRLLGGEAATGLALTIPIVVIMGGLVFMPLASTIFDSFFRIDPMRSGTPFIGLHNYASLMIDGDVVASWLNTIFYVVLAVVLETLFGLAMALLLNNIRHGRQCCSRPSSSLGACPRWLTPSSGCGSITRAMAC